ncbi:hypothetical protein LOTGIDRAFT_129925 [Lottia gigantea]|uniref:L-Fucosyltransferase n=1 Tax=Lottia gigantea TaxID=225164 RepID=V3Z5K8_LOTGI|nr:hypothetical protein LOTGIDRAFT_129925 [Lottia gigantea]ESO86048.1 hypothetical protein LOTGIDRAFT_129925 [Lottia gigantea]
MYPKVHSPIAVREEVLKWPQHTLCIYFEGGLGNHLFQYASAYGIAKSKGMGLVIDRRSYILTLFDMRPPPLTYNHVCECSRRKVIVEEKPCRFDPHVYDFKPNRDYRIRNFLQSWKYFENVINDIRQQYVIRQPFMDKGTEILRQSVARHYGDIGDVVPDDLVFVGLHVRRGDYIKKVKKLYGYRTAPKHYIFRSMQYFRDRYPHVIFIVCSNDMKWTKTALEGKNDAIFMTGNEREVDFAILTSMNHSITTVGTFSWWSAFLANGTVIYFRHFVVPNSQLRNEFSADFSDFFLHHWIPM